jgi:hypothetical protein
MATSSLVPTATPAPIVNQTPTTPSTIGSSVPSTSSVINPYIPPTAGIGVPNAGSTSSNSTATLNQLADIYGSGVGGDLTNLLNSIGGVNSATLQEFSQSLDPQEATAQANLNASLGAGGVSANSSVATLGDANLQAQETAAIAGESAQLTQSGQNLEASLLEGIEPAAVAEVAEDNPLNILGQVLGDAGSAVSTVMGLGAITGGFNSPFGGGGGSVPSGTIASQPLINEGYDSNGVLTLGNVQG